MNPEDEKFCKDETQNSHILSHF